MDAWQFLIALGLLSAVIRRLVINATAEIVAVAFSAVMFLLAAVTAAVGFPW